MNKYLNEESFYEIDAEYRKFMNKAGEICMREKVDPFEAMIAFLKVSLQELREKNKEANEEVKKAKEYIENGDINGLINMLSSMIGAKEEVNDPGIE